MGSRRELPSCTPFLSDAVVKVEPVKLYIMRHGPAGEHTTAAADFVRTLTPSGRQQTEAAARGLARLGVTPVRVLSSPRRRAFETAGYAAVACGGAPVEAIDLLGAEADPADVLEALGDLSRDTLIVGHEPQLSDLIAHLLGAQALDIDLSKAGVVALVFSQPVAAGTGRLKWYLRRSQLALLGSPS